jgi:hypothetical protein
MAQSLAKITIHVVFSTKEREPLLSNTIRNDLFAYIVGILSSLDCVTLIINGTEDHVHLVTVMSKTVSLSKMMDMIALPCQGGDIFIFPYPGQRRIAPLPWAVMLRPFRPEDMGQSIKLAIMGEMPAIPWHRVIPC